MQTSKKWEKQGNSIFTFWHNNQQIGTMKIASGSLKRQATAKIEGQEMVFKRTGFWKNSLEITDLNGLTIATVYPEKWYASSFILEYGDRKYKFTL